MAKIYDFEYVRKKIESYDYKMISTKKDYRNGSSKLIFRDNSEYLYKSSYNNFFATIKKGKPLIFGLYNEYAIYNAQIWINSHNRNWDVISRNYFLGKTGYFTFHCKDCNNNFEIKFESVRNMNCQCPYCQRKRVSSINSIANNSMQLSLYFNLEKNYPDNPNNVSVSSGKKYWWLCKECGYSWCASPNILIKNGRLSKCKICSGRLVSDKNKLLTLFPKIAKEWDYGKNKNLDINTIKYNCTKKVWWLCGQCSYSYIATVFDRTHSRHGCASCTGRIVTDKNRFSLLYPDIIIEWDYEKNDKSPDEFSFGSATKVWWICPICNSSYDCRIANRVHNRGCPICNLSSKAQQIFKILKNKNLNFESEYWFKDLRSDFNRVLKYDFAICDNNKNIIALIEYDDAQHTQFIPFMHKTIENFYSLQKRDLKKNEYARNNCIPLLRIDYKNKKINESISNFLERIKW